MPKNALRCFDQRIWWDQGWAAAMAGKKHIHPTDDPNINFNAWSNGYLTAEWHLQEEKAGRMRRSKSGKSFIRIPEDKWPENVKRRP